MSTLVLARKHRPRSFAALVGQEHVVQALSNALTRQRLHHAYLFTGTRGVGKTTVSRILAKALNCTGLDGRGGITAQPCGVCDACRDIDAGRFVDYVELDAASNRGVDEITQLLDQAVYKPVLGRFKVYMIDEVHMLSTTAFNAMLKTLEEPPDYLKFVLATTDPQKVPPTVLSRCLQFNLRPMAPETVQEHLARVLADEAIAAEPAALRLLARAARGSMRDALSLTDQAIAFGAGSLAEEGVRRMLGAVDRTHAVALVEALAAGDGAAVVATIDGLRGLGLSATGTLEELAGLLQQMAVLQQVPDAVDASDPDAPATQRLSALLAADETQLLYSIVIHGRAELALAPDEYSGLVMVLLRLLAFRPAGTPDTTRTGPAALRRTPATAASTAQVARMAARPVVVAPPQVRPSAPTPVRPAPAALVLAEEPPPWMDAPPPEDESGAPALASSRSAAAAGAAPSRAAVGRAAAAIEPAPAAPARAERPLVVTALGTRWQATVQALVEAGSIAALVKELAMQAQCMAIDEAGPGPVWTLQVEREMLRAPAQVEKLQAALREHVGSTLRLVVQAGEADDTPARRDAAQRALRQAQAEQLIHDDPVVRALMAQYATARIVPGSIKPH